jgi:hypothetical protein
MDDNMEENIMIKKKLITSLALGMCLMTLSTGSVVLAAETGETTQAYEVTSTEAGVDEGLVKKQAEIEQYVFVDHAEEIIALGFQVTNIGIVNDYIEIGITPFTEESANYLYEKLGKDSIQIAEGIPAELYTSGVAVAPDTPVADGGVDGNVTNEAVSNEGEASEGYVGEGVVLEEGQMGITSIDENAVDTVVDKAGEDLGDGKVYKGADAEVTSAEITEEATTTSYDPQIAEMTIMDNDIKDEGNNNVFIAIIAGSAAVLAGGIAFLARKMKLKK